MPLYRAALVEGAGVATRLAYWSDDHTIASNADLVADPTNGRLGIGTASPAMRLHVTSNNLDHIKLQYTGDTTREFYMYIADDRVWNFVKGAGDVGTLDNRIFRFGTIGAVDAFNPFWSAFQWLGHTVTGGGVSIFPIVSFYSRSAVAADPTDYEFVFDVGNLITLPGAISFRAPNLSGSFIRFGFGTNDSLRINQAGELVLKQMTTPTAPSSGFTSLYTKTGSALYALANGGTEVAVSAPVEPIQRIFRSPLVESGTFTPVSGTGYWVYLGQTTQALTPKYVEFVVTGVGTGAQTAEVGLFSTPAAPSKAAQTITKLVSTATVDALTSTGVKRNTTNFSTAVAVGTHLWAGIRTAMASTQPTIRGLTDSYSQGDVLSLAASGVLTGAGTWAGAIPAISLTLAEHPALRVTLD